VRTLVGEAARGGEAYPRRGPGNQRRLAVQSSPWLSSLGDSASPRLSSPVALGANLPQNLAARRGRAVARGPVEPGGTNRGGRRRPQASRGPTHC
jgi:hypothetical protein